MKRKLTTGILLLTLAIALPSVASAQAVVTLDWGGSTLTTGTTDTRTTPYALWYSQARHQYLITVADFAAIGLVPTEPVTFTSLGFFVTGLPTSWGHTRPMTNFRINMKNTSATSLTGFDNGAFTQVYSPRTILASDFTIPAWNTHTFDQDFVWDGVSNILVDVCFERVNFSYDRSYQVRYGRPSGPSSRNRYRNSDSYQGIMCTTSNNSNGMNYIPNMQLGCGGSSSLTVFTPPSVYEVPGMIPIPWTLGHQAKDFTGAITFNLYTPDGQLVSSEELTGINITAGIPVSGTYDFDATNIAPGFYRIEAIFNALNSCGFMDDVAMDEPMMLLAPGQTPCMVYPGDTDNNGVVNYGDRRALNTYIFEANMRTTWLNGPQRYRVDLEDNPLAYYTWEAQPGVPWFTPDGCYKDADGNGVINNFDYIAVKMNWMKSQASVPAKSSDEFTPGSFGMSNNYPNPFNPTTNLDYSVPERSTVSLTITDMLGREVTKLVDETVDAGTYTATFDAGRLASGQYLARINMVGTESGLSFSKTIKMVLSK